MAPVELIATVLFSDIRGFTTISEQLAEKPLLAWLNEYMSEMADLVLAHGGAIEKFAGDGLTAEFGVPEPRTDPAEIAADARAAVDCALAMSRAMVRLNQRWQARGLPEVGIRVGIHTGPLIVGNLGSAQRMQYSIIGDTANTAARLESYGKDDPRLGSDTDHCRILISEATLQHLAAAAPGAYHVMRVGDLALKGKAQPVAVHRVLPDARGCGRGKGDLTMTERRSRRAPPGLAGLALAALLLPASLLAQGGPAMAQQAAAPSVVYVPPDLGAPPTRTLAATRGLGAAPTIQVLAPAETGLTQAAQPTLFWYLAGPRNEAGRADPDRRADRPGRCSGSTTARTGRPGSIASIWRRTTSGSSPGGSISGRSRRWSIRNSAGPTSSPARRCSAARPRRSSPRRWPTRVRPGASRRSPATATGTICRPSWRRRSAPSRAPPAGARCAVTFWPRSGSTRSPARSRARGSFSRARR